MFSNERHVVDRFLPEAVPVLPLWLDSYSLTKLFLAIYLLAVDNLLYLVRVANSRFSLNYFLTWFICIWLLYPDCFSDSLVITYQCNTVGCRIVPVFITWFVWCFLLLLSYLLFTFQYAYSKFICYKDFVHLFDLLIFRQPAFMSETVITNFIATVCINILTSNFVCLVVPFPLQA